MHPSDLNELWQCSFVSAYFFPPKDWIKSPCLIKSHRIPKHVKHTRMWESDWKTMIKALTHNPEITNKFNISYNQASQFSSPLPPTPLCLILGQWFGAI